MVAPTSDGRRQTPMVHVWYAIIQKFKVACGFSDATINVAWNECYG